MIFFINLIIFQKPSTVGVVEVPSGSFRQNLYSILLLLAAKATCVGGQELYLLLSQDLLINPASSEPFPTTILTPSFVFFLISIQNLLISVLLKIFDVFQQLFRIKY